MVAFYIFGGILLILIVAVVAAPLVENRGQRGATGGQATDAGGRLEATLESLRELEFEFQTGKVGQEEYERLRAGFARQAIAAREELGRSAPLQGGRCPVCEAEVGEGARFCSRCGSPLAEGEADAASPESGEERVRR